MSACSRELAHIVRYVEILLEVNLENMAKNVRQELQEHTFRVQAARLVWDHSVKITLVSGPQKVNILRDC